MKLQHRLGLVPLLLALAVNAGCGRKDEARAATQVAAKVNAEEITVHQVNNLLAQSRDFTPQMAAQAKRQILDRLIDQQLARQQAIAKKLDRLPRVMQAIEAAKSEILARAYLEQIAAAQPEPTTAEVTKYYAEHPELFARRRLFTLEEIVVQPRQGLAASLREKVASTRSMPDIAAWLKSQGERFVENRGVRAAEEIPMDLLPQLQAMRIGELSVIEGGGRLNVFLLVAVQAAPIDEATAAPRIRKLFFNQRLAQAVSSQMAQYKGRSKIEYFGEFANGAPATTAKPADTAEPGRPPQPPGPDFANAVRALR
jgi:EpsD family peptidyl-prolyl cis-trans isomerase